MSEVGQDGTNRPSNDQTRVAEIVEHADLLLNSGDEVLSLTPDEWRKIRKAIGVDTDLLKCALAEAFDWLCPPKGVGAAGDALREYLLRILPLIDMSTNTVLGKSASAHETSAPPAHDCLPGYDGHWWTGQGTACGRCERCGKAHSSNERIAKEFGIKDWYRGPAVKASACMGKWHVPVITCAECGTSLQQCPECRVIAGHKQDCSARNGEGEQA